MKNKLLDWVGKVLDWISVLLTAAPTIITAIGGIVALIVLQIGDDWPWATQQLGVVAAWLAVATTIVRRVTPVAKELRGLLPKEAGDA